ncbi:hypothetical protein C7U60_08780 [Mesorhizobium plurifarium]|uniref:hypothetical protein n=1 Tax=Sinorhizobium arboris TaxID=76745 RepID=UPI00040EDA52|nr:hypothetical protein [Sinorhizobium arboris]PST24706.1 hypothetical protein C7U60_08780 [Mesorhizobium plurifarium]
MAEDAAVVVIGISGEAGLWLADLRAGTVVPLAPPSSGGLQNVNDLRSKGATIVKGVNLAVTVRSADDAFSGHYDG